MFNELKCINVISLIIGEDPSYDQNYLKKLVDLKSGNTFILGSKENVVDYLSNSDCFVISSINEGLPISVLEAFCLGLFVITTPAGGLISLMKNFNGIVSQDLSVEKMLNSIHQFLKIKSDERNKISNMNKEIFSSSYNIDTCAASYVSLYTNI